MATPHIFVVNTRTFPLHLEFQFAGITPGKPVAQHIGLLADIARTRPGDPVLFYLQGYGFYGIFRITSEPLYEPPDGWLQAELGLPLIYRVRIEPYEIYPLPVTEWEAIDRLPLYSRDIRWSLLYRKLKGERGCSYLFPHELESMRQLLQEANPDGPLEISGEGHLTWREGKICWERDIPARPYKGSSKSPADQIQVHRGEKHLQAWLAWHIGRDPSLQKLTGNSIWFANEVYAGTGMQRMDLLTLEEEKGRRRFRILELKARPAAVEDAEQMRRYIWWLRDYVAMEGDLIRPVWVTLRVPPAARTAMEEIAAKEGCETLEIWTWRPQGRRPLFEQIA